MKTTPIGHRNAPARCEVDQTMNYTALATEDTTETHVGNPNAPDPNDLVTFVWFCAMIGHGQKVTVIALRIQSSVATVCASHPALTASQVRPFGLAWARCLAFLDANPGINVDAPDARA